MADYKDPDEFFEARLRKPLDGIDENSGETRRQAAVLLGVKAPAGEVGEKSLGDQVFTRPTKDGAGNLHPFETIVGDANQRIVRTESAVKRVEEKLDRLLAKLDEKKD